MVSPLDTRSSAPGSSPGKGHRVVFSSKTPSSIHSDVLKGNAEFNTGGNPVMDQHPICDGLASYPEGSRNTPSRFMLQKPGQV